MNRSPARTDSVLWRTRPLADLSENFDAIRVPVKESDRQLGPYPYYGASGVVDHVDQYLFDGEYLLVAEDGENLRTRNTPISFLGTGKFWVNNHAHILRGNARASTRYLMYALSHLDISGYLTGSTMPKLTQRNLARIAIPTPPLSVQRAITDILGALDDKIELNRRMNETAEAMARALFKSWFVDFDPVQAKIAGRDTYLSGPISSLFPESLGVDGNPAGWVIKPLDEVATFLNGLALQRFPASDVAESLPVIKIAELRNGVTRKSSRASLEVPANYQVHDGDFLFSWSGSLLAKFWTGGPGALNQHLFKVTSSEYPNWFFSQWIYQHLDQFRATAKSKATTMGHIQRRHLNEALTVCPPKLTLEAMDVVFGPMIARIVHNDVESRTLGLVRDTLLPKLISGELRVPDAERLVESVT